jgi:hypothetical protein
MDITGPKLSLGYLKVPLRVHPWVAKIASLRSLTDEKLKELVEDGTILRAQRPH